MTYQEIQDKIVSTFWSEGLEEFNRHIIGTIRIVP